MKLFFINIYTHTNVKSNETLKNVEVPKSREHLNKIKSKSLFEDRENQIKKPYVMEFLRE